MNCANRFCIYWSDDKCILDSVSLDITGLCEDCIYVNIEESVLQAYRKQLSEDTDLF